MEQLANNPVTTLSSGINSSVTSVTVASATAFPTAGNFTIKIENELLKVTAVAGNVFTVTRHTEGTSAASHSSGATVKLVTTADTLYNLLSESYQIGPWASRPTIVRSGSVYQATDAYLAWQYDGTNWNLIAPVYVPYSKRVDMTGWTALNHGGSAVFTNMHGVLNVTQPVAALAFRGYYKSILTAPYKLNLICGTMTDLGNRQFVSVGVYDSAGGRLRTVSATNASSAQTVTCPEWTSVSALSSVSTERRVARCKAIYIRFEDDNTNWNFYFSQDGIGWTKFSNNTRNSFVTPNSIALGVAYNNSQPAGATVPFDIYGYWEGD